MRRMIHNRLGASISVGCLLILFLLTACGGSASMSVPASHNVGNAPGSGSQGNPNGSQGKQGQQKGLSAIGQQYLIKALRVDMQIKGTRQVAADLQSWIKTTDPRASSAGIDYEQTDNNLYTVAMTFSVQASLYPDIQNYLRDYAPQHGGKLLDLRETVQDVSNDFIDTQSRLKNLRGEQDRLLTLLSHATAMGDILSIEQRLTDIEGQIEQIEAHLNALNGQTTFYNITINLQPSEVPVAQVDTPGWSPGQVLHDAWGAALSLGQGLVTIFLWLVAFSIYLIPIVLVIWLFLRWWRTRNRPAITPAPATPSASPEQTHRS